MLCVVSSGKLVPPHSQTAQFADYPAAGVGPKETKEPKESDESRETKEINEIKETEQTMGA